MAKKRKTKTTRRRRRVSGIGQDLDLQALGLAVGGAVLSNVLATNFAKSTNTTMQKAGPYAGLIAGVVLPLIVKNPMVKQLSLGLVAGGGVSALKAAKVISGLDMNTINGSLNKYRSLPYRKAVAGIGLGQPSKSNFSGSRLSQMHTIAGMNHAGAGGGEG
jgi:hypothetical protein